MFWISINSDKEKLDLRVPGRSLSERVMSAQKNIVLKNRIEQSSWIKTNNCKRCLRMKKKNILGPNQPCHILYRTLELFSRLLITFVYLFHKLRHWLCINAFLIWLTSKFSLDFDKLCRGSSNVIQIHPPNCDIIIHLVSRLMLYYAGTNRAATLFSHFCAIKV